MEFRLNYNGVLVSNRYDTKGPKRAIAKHAIRQHFHRQLKILWSRHRFLKERIAQGKKYPDSAWPTVEVENLSFLPMVTHLNGLMCAVDTLMLRHGQPGEALADIDNRLKAIFDASRMPRSFQELGATDSTPPLTPCEGETPFYVLLEDDSLITRVSVNTDMLLSEVEPAHADNVRLFLTIKVSPYYVTLENSSFL